MNDPVNPLVEALQRIGTVVTWCTTTIAGNTILFTMFVASLVIVGFKIFKRAKKAARS